MTPLPPRSASLLLVLGAAAALAACAGGPPAPSAGGSRMGAHYGQVTAIQEAVIAGNVDATRAPARWLSTHEGSEFPPAAGPALEAMRNEARIMLQQRDILLVARTLGRMGVACGTCHTALNAGVAFPAVAAPAATATGREHMLRHAWATARLWEGLAAPSDPLWNAGVEALTSLPLEFGSNDQANRLARRVHELSDQARQASTPKERADTYGDLLETCALCHATLGLRIR